MQAEETQAPEGASEAATNGDTGTAAVDADISNAWATVDNMINGFIALLPKLAIAAVVFIIFLVVAWAIKKLVVRYTKGHEASNVGLVLGRLTQWLVIFVGLMCAVAIVAPTVTPGKLIAGLGVGSVAIGFAFKDILQNFLAGILILLRQPFDVGDQVVFGDHEGKVEQIDTRSTLIRTYDGKRVIIPNGQVYTNPMTVLTAHDARRSQYDIGIGYGDDIETAKRAILETLKQIDGVMSDPAPDVLTVDLAESTVNLRARWWTDPRRASVVEVNDRVMTAIKKRLDDDSIDMPFPTQVVLHHDQTEETDGDRKRQREGWPEGDDPPRARNLPQAVERHLEEKASQKQSDDGKQEGRNGDSRSDASPNGSTQNVGR